MDKSDLVTLVVALCSLLAALASQRQSAKATRGTNQTSITNARTEAETEAYIRARAMDTETINRQGGELKELRVELNDLRDKYDVLEDKYDKVMDDNKRLRRRVIDLEKHQV